MLRLRALISSTRIGARVIRLHRFDTLLSMKHSPEPVPWQFGRYATEPIRAPPSGDQCPQFVSTDPSRLNRPQQAGLGEPGMPVHTISKTI